MLLRMLLLFGTQGLVTGATDTKLPGPLGGQDPTILRALAAHHLPAVTTVMLKHMAGWPTRHQGTISHIPNKGTLLKTVLNAYSD